MQFPDISEALARLLQEASAAAVYEARGRRGELDPAIQSMVQGTRLAGRAYTIRAHPQHGAGVAAASGGAPAGSVIVVDVGQDEGTCALGGTGALAAQMRGVQGCVTNGRVRDLAEIRDLRFPVYALGGTLRSGRPEGPVATGVPVAVGGQIIHPGDLLVADDDGVLVVPADELPLLADRLATRLAFEREADARVREGVPYAEAVRGRPRIAD